MLVLCICGSGPCRVYQDVLCLHLLSFHVNRRLTSVSCNQAGALVSDNTSAAGAQNMVDNDPEEEEEGLGYDETATASVRTPEPVPAIAQGSGDLPCSVMVICGCHHSLAEAVSLIAALSFRIPMLLGQHKDLLHRLPCQLSTNPQRSHSWPSFGGTQLF